MTKTVLNVTIARLVSLIVFLVLLAIANVLYINDSVYLGVVGFLNTKILVIITFSILLYLGELFFVFGFPLNFPAPIFNAFGGVMLVDFIFDIFIMLGNILNQSIFILFSALEIFVLVIVLILVLLVGYVKVFSSVGKKKEKKHKAKKVEEHDWDDVKREIKTAVYHATKNLSDKLKPEEVKKKSVKKKVGVKKKVSVKKK